VIAAQLWANYLLKYGKIADVSGSKPSPASDDSGMAEKVVVVIYQTEKAGFWQLATN